MRHDEDEHPIISQAISQLILGQPWYATLALRLRVRRNDKIPTACVDGVTLQYNEKWLASLPAYQTKAVIAHEVMHCLATGTPVMTRRGLVPIEKVVAGDYVWSGNNAGFTRVLRSDSRAHHGAIVTITPAFAEPVSITGNHRVLAYDRVTERTRYIPAGDLNRGRHMLVCPLPDNKDRGIKARKVGRTRDSYTQHKVWFDEDIARLTGWFVADGNLAKGQSPGSTKRCVVWTLGEKDDAKWLVRVIGEKLRREATVSAVPGAKARRVTVSAKTYANFLTKHFYDGEDKTIPAWLLGQTESVIQAFVDGYSAGDGYRSGDFTTTSSVSPGISGMLPLLLMRLGYRPTMSKMAASKGTLANARPAKRIKWASRPEVSEKRGDFIKGRKWYVPIRELKTVPYDGQVHNIATVSGSYSLPFFAVHNCALLHMTRRGGRNPMIWNLAGDNVINLELEAAGFKLPADCVKEDRFRGMGTEQVYAILRQEIKDVEVFVYVDGLGGVKDAPKEGEGEKDGKGKKAGKKGGTVVLVSSGLGEAAEGKGPEDKGKGRGKAGGVGDGDGDGSGEGSGEQEGDDSDAAGEGLDAGDLEHEWEIAAASASMVAQRAGHLPAGADRAVRAARSQTDWRETLQKYLVMAGDYSWTRPNRRHVHSGLYLPGSRVDRPGRVVIAVDTSGSINQQMLEKFAGEAKYILDAAGWPESVYLIYCDAQVQGAREVEQADGIDFSDMKGGGGTYAQPVFDHVREMGVEKGQREPVVLFYLTDLDLGDRPVDPGYPVVWVVPDWVYHQSAPFGELVRVEMEGGRYGY